MYVVCVCCMYVCCVYVCVCCVLCDACILAGEVQSHPPSGGCVCVCCVCVVCVCVVCVCVCV